jgi:hypothetical protein
MKRKNGKSSANPRDWRHHDPQQARERDRYAGRYPAAN